MLANECPAAVLMKSFPLAASLDPDDHSFGILARNTELMLAALLVDTRNFTGGRIDIVKVAVSVRPEKP